jgi:hypothetical protein
MNRECVDPFERDLAAPRPYAPAFDLSSARAATGKAPMPRWGLGVGDVDHPGDAGGRAGFLGELLYEPAKLARIRPVCTGAGSWSTDYVKSASGDASGAL